MKKILVVCLAILLIAALFTTACSTPLGHSEDHDHDGDGKQDHTADEHEDDTHKEEDYEKKVNS